MYKEVLQNIDSVEIWPIISFLIFFLFFIILLFRVFTVDKKFIRYMKELPLKDQPDRQDNSSGSNDQLHTKTAVLK